MLNQAPYMPPDSSTPQTGWYCVRSQPKREHIAAGQLERIEGVEVFSPRIRFRRNTKRGKVWFEESLFPGYLFARFDFFSLVRMVSSAVGVQGMVRFAGECAIVPDILIETLRKKQFDAETVVIMDEPAVRVGDEAVVTEGALLGLQAVITQVMPGGERVKILMDMMGTAIEAEMPVSTIEKVS